MTTYRRCTYVEADGRACKAVTYVGELCFTHARRARRDKENLPAYGGGVLSKYEARTRTESTPETEAVLSVEPVTRTEPSDGYIEWDDDDHIDPLDRIENMAAEYKRTRWGG